MTAMKDWRTRMGWSQRRAAQELGVTLPTYQSWERGVRLSDGSLIDPPLTALLAAAAREKGLDPI
ncbi:hypothetical protein A3Q32_10355 [Alcanivorax sp. KX64203]|nr:hypothetical protein A3Q32_10355 [Alcanivorax sp. KX64203]